MFVQFLERPADLKNLLNSLDPAVKIASQSFCLDPRSRDQSFGTEAEWKPEDLVPTLSTTNSALASPTALERLGDNGKAVLEGVVQSDVAGLK